MTVSRQSLLVRWFFIASALLLILGTIMMLIEHPVVVTTAGTQGAVYLIVFVLALFIYGWIALFRTKVSTPAERLVLQQGTLWGLLCGGVWVIELLVANMLDPHLEWLYLVLYYGSVFSGFLLPGLASLLVTWHTRRIVSGVQTGVLCGMFGGLMIFLAFFVLSPALFHAGLHDPQSIHEFQRSSLPDITTYMVSDYLAGMIVHLWIGLITGFFLGMLGGIFGKAIHLPERTSLEAAGKKASLY